MRTAIEQYCAMIGKDPLLVQGAGGNISWKEDNTLWIKASGTRLAEAQLQDIFVPVDLQHLQDEMRRNNFEVIPRLTQVSSLRPSIETHFHALIPHQIVVHLHAINILSYLVRMDAEPILQSLMPSSISWAIVDYHKPGPDLAKAVNQALTKNPLVNVIFLLNHGVIIGGANLNEIDDTLKMLIQILPTESAALSPVKIPKLSLTINQDKAFIPLSDQDVHQLATNPELFNRLATDWALYPDHVVFLGNKPIQYSQIDLCKQDLINKPIPELVFIEHVGVFSLPSFSITKQEQLRCYYDVLSRQACSNLLSSLNSHQIAELLNWDAEQYRMNIVTTQIGTS